MRHPSPTRFAYRSALFFKTFLWRPSSFTIAFSVQMVWCRRNGVKKTARKVHVVHENPKEESPETVRRIFSPHDRKSGTSGEHLPSSWSSVSLHPRGDRREEKEDDNDEMTMEKHFKTGFDRLWRVLLQTLVLVSGAVDVEMYCLRRTPYLPISSPQKEEDEEGRRTTTGGHPHTEKKKEKNSLPSVSHGGRGGREDVPSSSTSLLACIDGECERC